MRANIPWCHRLGAALVFVITLAHVAFASPVDPATSNRERCRYVPGDTKWPKQEAWSKLNRTVGGRLISSIPLARSCYKPNVDDAACAKIRSEWTQLTPL